MGLFGRMTGWDQQKDAHNAVLASHMADTASPELRREIVRRIVIIQQQVRGHGSGVPRAIVAELSELPRIVQMNFIALACNSLGIPPTLRNLHFQDVENPYRSDNSSSIDRIGVALDDLSRRSGRQLYWPGNHMKVDFLAWDDFGPMSRAGEVASMATAKPIHPEVAVDLAFERLLGCKIRMDALLAIATELPNAVEFSTDYELALATAQFFFEQPELKQTLALVQRNARSTNHQWCNDGVVSVAVASHFENQLHQLFRS